MPAGRDVGNFLILQDQEIEGKQLGGNVEKRLHSVGPTADVEPKLVSDSEEQKAPENAGLSFPWTHLPNCQGLCTLQPWRSSPQGP